MGHTGREPPFFFMKPADAVLGVPRVKPGALPYPAHASNLHHEIELVAAIGVGGQHIKSTDALAHVFGYAVGLDMTRRDLQNDMKKQGRPWCIGKGFDPQPRSAHHTRGRRARHPCKLHQRCTVNGTRASTARLIAS
jgi:fumarylpyruvate hydrolase